jgi:N-acetylmuramic acid 6-phosphate etherase
MFTRITESDSLYRHIEKMSVREVLENINHEDQKVAVAVEACVPQIEAFVTAAAEKMKAGGRLFYMGAGTSGRLGVLDASECPPTYGVSPDLVVGLIAGGDHALRHPVEDAEDNKTKGWEDLLKYQVSEADVVLGIAASGTTPYVIEALRMCQSAEILTACITCNPNAPLTQVADYQMVVNVGPEFVTGSTRMKSGTAQKLILNMISTTLMIQLGKVEDNKMVHMQLKNEKLRERGVLMLMQKIGISDYEAAKILLEKHGSVFKAVEAWVN